MRRGDPDVEVEVPKTLRVCGGVGVVEEAVFDVFLCSFQSVDPWEFLVSLIDDGLGRLGCKCWVWPSSDELEETESEHSGVEAVGGEGY